MQLQIAHKLEGGDGVNLNLIHPLPLEFHLTYDGCEYEGHLRVPNRPSELETIKLVAKGNAEKVLVSWRHSESLPYHN